MVVSIFLCKTQKDRHGQYWTQDTEKRHGQHWAQDQEQYTRIALGTRNRKKTRTTSRKVDKEVEYQTLFNHLIDKYIENSKNNQIDSRLVWDYLIY
jgi:hypothetical protein